MVDYIVLFSRENLVCITLFRFERLPHIHPAPYRMITVVDLFYR